MAVARALFRALIPSWVEMGLSASGMVREARALGVPTYRNIDMLADIREFQGFMRRESLVTKWDVNKVPHHGLMTEVGLRRDRRYRIFSNVTTQDRITGEVDTHLVSFYSDEKKSFAEWESDYQSMVEESAYDPGVDILYMQTRAVEHNKGWAY